MPTFPRFLAVILLLLAAAPVQAQAVSDTLRLLAFGDSLTHGYGLPAGESFPEQLEDALRERGYAVEVINAGNSGDTSAAGRARLEWSLADGPDAALVELGANDGLRGLDPAATYDNLDAILARFEDAGVPVLLAGMKAPRNMGADYAEAFDAIYPKLAAEHDVLFYPFFLEGVALDPALNQPDGIHPNAKGVREIVERILPKVIALVDSARGHSATLENAERDG